MSNKELARRAAAEIYFAGVDVSAAARKYLISLTYTDNEEDESDDLQIRLEDRDGIWMEQWLNAAVQAAASSPSGAAAGGAASQYKVTAKSGLNVRSGPGTSHGKLGALTYGSTIEVSAIADGWASIKYSGKDAYVSASYIQEVEGGSPSTEASDESTVKGLSVQAVILRENWKTDGKDDILDCGEFELDSVNASGPPAEITIKCTSLPYNARIRQTKKSKSWEGYTLSRIANQMAAENGMACLYESASDPEYERLEQITESDILFLSTLCHNAGISLKATNNILVLFDQAAFEAQGAVATITKGDGRYLKYKLSTGAADTKYASCRVSYTNPDTGAAISAIAYAEDYKADAKDNQQLEITAKVNSVGEAQALAEKSLRLKNKYEYSASFTLPGDPGLVAGVTIMLAGWGPWSGKYIIKQAKHTLGNSGYTTQITLRRVLEGY